MLIKHTVDDMDTVYDNHGKKIVLHIPGDPGQHVMWVTSDWWDRGGDAVVSEALARTITPAKPPCHLDPVSKRIEYAECSSMVVDMCANQVSFKGFVQRGPGENEIVGESIGAAELAVKQRYGPQFVTEVCNNTLVSSASKDSPTTAADGNVEGTTDLLDSEAIRSVLGNDKTWQPSLPKYAPFDSLREAQGKDFTIDTEANLRVDFNNIEKRIIVLSSSPPAIGNGMNNTTCYDLLSAAVLHKEGSNWIVEDKYPLLTVINHCGDADTKYSYVQLGPDKLGIRLTTDEMHQGGGGDESTFLLLDGKAASQVLHINTMSQPCPDAVGDSTKIAVLDTVTNGLYDLRTVRTGDVKTQNASAKQIQDCSFNGHTYVCHTQVAPPTMPNSQAIRISGDLLNRDSADAVNDRKDSSTRGEKAGAPVPDPCAGPTPAPGSVMLTGLRGAKASFSGFVGGESYNDTIAHANTLGITKVGDCVARPDAKGYTDCKFIGTDSQTMTTSFYYGQLQRIDYGFAVGRYDEIRESIIKLYGMPMHTDNGDSWLYQNVFSLDLGKTADRRSGFVLFVNTLKNK